MKLLIEIDQKASLLQGHEAPNSSERYDLPVASIPEKIRAIIIPKYDTRTGRLADFSASDKDLMNGPQCTHPLTEDKVLAALTDWAERCERSRRQPPSLAERRDAALRRENSGLFPHRSQ